MGVKRIDQLLVEQSIVSSRTIAQKIIAAGQVEAKIAGIWQKIEKPSTKLDVSIELRASLGDEQKYASRAGLKLEGALQSIGLDVEGLLALDVGQSTGGFSDCLLQHKIQKVVGIDVGRDQLIPRIRNDKRVVCLEGINARELDNSLFVDHAPKGFDLLVMDVSFISQTLIVPGLVPLMADNNSMIVSLVKPQFEVGREGIGKGGLVKDARLYADVEDKLREHYRHQNLRVIDYFESPIQGGDGNREFFIVGRRQ